jgi:hypothetical protein
MYDFLRDQWERALDEPVEALLKPVIKAAIVIALLVTAAEWARWRSFDRDALAQLAGAAVKDPARTGSLKRP